jgi:hypothetical protein
MHDNAKIETCIHPGRGLPEWSSLVVRGKEEREERKDYLMKTIIENAKKQAHSNRRILEHSRRASINSTSGAPRGKL